MASVPSVARPAPSSTPSSGSLEWRTRTDSSSGPNVGRPGRGIARGGRGSSRGGRGTRGGRGLRGGIRGSVSQPEISTPPQNNNPPTDAQKSELPPPPVLQQKTVGKVEQNSVVSSGSLQEPPPTERPKPKPRRSSRSIPAVAVAPASPSVEADALLSPLSTGRPQNRRKRSQGPSPGNSTGKGKIPPPLDSSLLKPQKGRVKPAPHSAPIRDAPPHMSSSHLTTDIDALVERVRAVAMDNRPVTPGSQSHIDWAGDDDDSLPDLDDWGVKATTDPTDSRAQGNIPLAINPSLEATPEKSTSKRIVQPGNPKPDSHVSANSPNGTHSPETPRTPLHPSLPPKPVLTQTPIPPQKYRHVAAPMRSPHPRPPPDPSAYKGNSSAQQPAERPKAIDNAVPPHPDPKTEILKNPVPPQAVPAKAPSVEVYPKETELEIKPSVVSAEILPTSRSAPSDVTVYSSSSTDKSIDADVFTPKHNRTNTLGRPNFPFPNGRYDQHGNRASRSGFSTPRGRFAAQHARTHSSPPSTHAQNHRVPQSRPVLTGAAISQINRTLVGKGHSPSPSRGSTEATHTNGS